MAKVVTNTNIDELLSSEQPVLIDFWAAWCGPCKRLSPTVDEIAEEYDGRAVVAKCNVDDADEVAMSYGIRSIPTLIFFKDGKMVQRLIGVVSKEEIESVLNTIL